MTALKLLQLCIILSSMDCFSSSPTSKIHLLVFLLSPTRMPLSPLALHDQLLIVMPDFFQHKPLHASSETLEFSPSY